MVVSRRLKAMRFQHLRRLRNDWLGDENGAGLRHALYPGRDIDRLAEIVLALVQHHCQARPLVDADLEAEAEDAGSLQKVSETEIRFVGQGIIMM